MDKKVILISIDGLRPDAVETCGHPFVNTLKENGCYSPDASSVVPPVTLPAHTSIFYSVPPIRHGIITNDYMPPVRPIRGLAEQLERADKTCAAFYGWEPMRHVWTSGNMKYSLFVNEYEEDNSDLLLTQEALSLIERKEPDCISISGGNGRQRRSRPRLDDIGIYAPGKQCIFLRPAGLRSCP